MLLFILEIYLRVLYTVSEVFFFVFRVHFHFHKCVVNNPSNKEKITFSISPRFIFCLGGL